IFFFSSRRRHTRSKRDWSSDVCSSDLAFSLALVKEPESTKSKVMAKVQDGLFAYLRAQGWDTTEEMCISYVCFEGTKANVEREKAIVKKIVSRNGGITLEIGRASWRERGSV